MNATSLKISSSLINFFENRRLEILSSEAKILENLVLQEENSKIFCALIYGCEGAKYPSSQRMALTNSDPLLVRNFVFLLRKSFTLDESKWRVILQIHNNHNYTKLRKFWSEQLEIPQRKFLKPTITVPKNRKHRIDYRGTCTVRYYDYKIQLKLIGIFEAFMRKLALHGGIA